MAKRYRVTLTGEERQQLEALTTKGKGTARKFIHARALLLCDHASREKPWKTVEVAKALGVTSRTIEHVKQRFVEEGIESALGPRPRSKPREVTFDGAFQARLTALACSPAPEGRKRWTMRLLAEKVVELEIAPEVSVMTIQRTLKKPNLSLT